MAKEEIIGGIRNALERGYSLEEAVRSFVNAGYNPQEVKAAAQEISSGASTFISQNQELEQRLTKAPAPTFAMQTPTQTVQQKPQQQLRMPQRVNAPPAPPAPAPAPTPNSRAIPQLPRVKPATKKGDKKKVVIIILMVFFLFVLFGALGYLVYYITK